MLYVVILELRKYIEISKAHKHNHHDRASAIKSKKDREDGTSRMTHYIGLFHTRKIAEWPRITI